MFKKVITHSMHATGIIAMACWLITWFTQSVTPKITLPTILLSFAWFIFAGLTIYFAVILSQIRAITRGSNALQIVSLTGLSLMTLVVAYTGFIFLMPVLTGMNTNAPLFGLTSYLAKFVLVFAAFLLQSAFIFSYVHGKLSKVQWLSLLTGCVAAIFWVAVINRRGFYGVAFLFTVLSLIGTYAVYSWRKKIA